MRTLGLMGTHRWQDASHAPEARCSAIAPVTISSSNTET